MVNTGPSPVGGTSKENMGTNFYVKVNGKRTHIGKRSGAGYYCFRCNVSLCEGGGEGVHQGNRFYTHCPICLTAPHASQFLSESDDGGSVRGCCSFSWAMEPNEFMALTRGIVTNDNGDEVRGLKRFMEEVLDECPISFIDHIGSEFS